MENDNLDETIAGKSLLPQEPAGKNELIPETNPDLEQTVPISLSEPGPDPDATMQTSLNPSIASSPGSDETMEVRTGLNLAGIEATIPPPPGSPGSKPSPKKKRPSIRLAAILGVLGLLLIAVLSAFGGYWSGISARKDAEVGQSLLRAQEQFDLGVQDMEAGNYDIARQRFEYVIQLAPDYPGVTDRLAEAIFKASITATPTFVPTPTLSPTPDLRGAEDLFNQARQQIFNSEWAPALDTLLTLRKSEPDYQPVLVDDMFYLSYRNFGKDKILKDSDLEGGIYFLTLAERIGPLDSESKGYLTWTRLYLTGASFWDVDWGQAVYYLGQVAPALPNLRDSSGWTATDRYKIALVKYGDQLSSRKEWCTAVEHYQLAINMGASETGLQDAFKLAYQKCTGNSGETTPQPEQTQSPDVTEEPPVEESPTPAP